MDGARSDTLSNTPHTPFSSAFLARFWAKIDKTAGTHACWLWTASADRHGYGQIWFRKTVCRAHRVAFELVNGPIPEGQVVRHKCDIPLCCNPAHLDVGSAADNVQDMDSRGRRRRVTAPQFGEKNGNAKLTAADIPAIRVRAAAGESYSVLGREYGVHEKAIDHVVRRKRWKHIR